MEFQTLISLIFYIIFVIYILLGVYSITLNKKESLNRVFLFICLSISIWSFAFTFFNSARTYEDALLWRRISSLGWGVTYSILVHFTLVLTGANNILKKKITYVALYLPAIINVTIFGLYSKVANEQYQLIHTAAGWACIPLNNMGDLFYNCYYLFFSLLTFLLLIRWYIKSTDAIKRKHALYLMISFCVSLLLGTLTDSLANRYLTFKLPSLAPIIILIPVATIHYIIHKYGLMLPKEKHISPQDGIILSADKRTNLFKFISMIFFLGSVTNIFLYLVYSNEWLSGIVLSAILVLCGAFIFVIPSVIQSIKFQENILTILMVVSMIMIMFFYYDRSVSNIVWPVPLFFIMVTIIFNNKKMFLVIATISLLAGLLSWIMIPEITIQLGTLAYLFRIAFYMVGIILTSYINKIYISRLKENDQQVQFQKMISAISTNFVTITSSNFEDKIIDLLEKSGSYTHADRSYLGLFSEDQTMINFTHEWLGEGIDSITINPEGLQVTHYTWASKKILAGEIVFTPSVELLPPEASMEKEIMISQDIKSLIFIPISNKDKVIGFIGFDQIKVQKGWRIEDHDLLKVLANIVSDAIAKVEVEKEINYLAYYDALTGLPNRTLLNNRLEQAIQLARSSEKLIGLIFIDLDGFKAVNDTLGHDWGDDLLKQVVDRLSHCISKYDTFARFGGDEFLIMVPQISEIKDVEVIAKKVMGIFHKPILVNKQEFFISASAGIAIFPEDGDEVSILIKNADLAMYFAKNNGKSQYTFCSTDMKEDVLNKTILTNSLYRAQGRDELLLHYQPQVCIETKEIIGIEALIRWEHPDLGRILPSVFIPIAEQTGLINSIGEWVLKTACRQNKVWQDLGFKPVKMAVNISVEQFRSGNLLHIVEECLKETGLDPKYLELEITESIAMKESHHIIKSLQELKALGISISIDDFGTEYSSLSRLKDMPVDRLKMDILFVRGIALNTKDKSIISVIIHLAKSLGLKVIAEGVETEIQLQFLTELACDEVQGYYFYKPMTKEDIERDVLKILE